MDPDVQVVPVFVYLPQQAEIADLRREFGRARGLARFTKLRSGDLMRTLSDLAVMVRTLERLGIQKGLFTREELGSALREVLAEEAAALGPESGEVPGPVGVATPKAPRKKKLKNRLR